MLGSGAKERRRILEVITNVSLEVSNCQHFYPEDGSS
jgi:hypothetical protein